MCGESTLAHAPTKSAPQQKGPTVLTPVSGNGFSLRRVRGVGFHFAAGHSSFTAHRVPERAHRLAIDGRCILPTRNGLRKGSTIERTMRLQHISCAVLVTLALQGFSAQAETKPLTQSEAVPILQRAIGDRMEATSMARAGVGARGSSASGKRPTSHRDVAGRRHTQPPRSHLQTVAETPRSMSKSRKPSPVPILSVTKSSGSWRSCELMPTRSNSISGPCLT